MIIDNIKNWERYAQLDSSLVLALKYLAEHVQDLTPEADHVSLSDKVEAFYLNKMTSADAQMEVHLQKFDLHLIQTGAERCETGALPQEYDYQESSDIAFFPGEATGSFLVEPGDFYVVWPGEVHKPLCNPQTESVAVKKIVCKVKA